MVARSARWARSSPPNRIRLHNSKNVLANLTFMGKFLGYGNGFQAVPVGG
jgi:hypothetical protein